MQFRDSQADAEQFFECDECKQESCLKCKGRWHQGQTCEEAELRCQAQKKSTGIEPMHEEEERLTKEYLEKKMRKCPGFGCGVPIMRDRMHDDCDKMKCKFIAKA